MIAAGGLAPSDLEAWLKAGHDAVALGRDAVQTSTIHHDLLTLLRVSTTH